MAASTASIDPPASRAPTRRIALVVAAYLVIVLIGTLMPLVSTRNPFIHFSPELQANRLALWLVWLAVLVETMRRQPQGPMWWLIFAYVAAEQISRIGYYHNSVVWSLSLLLGALYVPIYIHLLLAFPSGHLVRGWDKAIAGFYYVVIAAFSVLVALTYELPLFSCATDCLVNVFVVWPDAEVYEWLRVASVLIPVVATPLIFVRLWVHWQDATMVGRRAILPVLVAMPIVIGTTALEFIGDRFLIEPLLAFYASALAPLPLFVLPLGLLAGLLRLRLSKGRTADLIVELGRGVPIGGLRDVLARTLGDPSLELAFAAPSGEGFVDAGGRPVELPVDDATRAVTRLEHDGDLLGVLIHDPAVDVEDPGLVAAVGSAATMALENERLTAQVRAQLDEVRASRFRIVEAGDAERQRIERDLHDGAQQRLVALAMRLQLAKETNDGAAGLLDEATSELQSAIDEVRVLARGLHPPILTESGLGAAVEALAERAPLPVTTRVPETRYPPTVEATAYFVVSEALTNVARHAAASEAVVTVEETGRRLVITVRDDGRGGADPAGGSGMRGLTDRVVAAGGELRITSREGHGTSLVAELPLP